MYTLSTFYIKLILRSDDAMEGFRLNSDRSETLNKTIRFPLELTKEIENDLE